MKAIIVKEPGGPEKLITTEIDQPTIQNNKVLVKVKAIGINPVDVKTRANEQMLQGILGPEKPWILGWDIAGKIVAIGRDVTEFKIGDEVFGMVNFPGHGMAYAEYVAAPASHLTTKPTNITHNEAAAATLAALTAYQALVSNAKIKAKDRVLIHGASGGVGHYAVQIAKSLGAYVIATASAENKDLVLAIGADEVIDYKVKAFENETKDIDFVFDLFGGTIYDNSLKIVKKGGTIITLPAPLTPEQEELTKQYGINGYRIIVQSSAEDMFQIAKLLESGKIKSVISSTYKFPNVQEAHIQVEKGRTVGKVIVTLE